MIEGLLSITKKIKQFRSEHGLKALFIKLRMHSLLFIKNWVNKNIRKICPIHEVLSQAFPHAAPIASLKIQRGSPRVNLVLDHLKEESFFGSVGTALILAALFANKQNMPLRIISRKHENHPDQFFKFLKLQNIPPPKKMEFFSDYDREITLKRQRIETSDQDIYLATSWWSAEAIQSANFRPSYFHMVQDTPQNPEEMFRHSLSLKNPKGRFISNVKSSAINSCCFSPAFPEKTHAPSPETFKRKSSYKLFFYARPQKPQNHFFTGLKLLDEALTRGILPQNEWEIYFAGEAISSLIFSSGLKPKSLGKMDWEDYLSFIKKIDLGIALLDSPHPNYPALDIAAAGGVVLTNSLNHCHKSQNIIYSPLESLIQGLSMAIPLAKDPERRLSNFKNNRIECNWEEAFKETLQYMDSNK